MGLNPGLGTGVVVSGALRVTRGTFGNIWGTQAQLFKTSYLGTFRAVQFPPGAHLVPGNIFGCHSGAGVLLASVG